MFVCQNSNDNDEVLCIIYFFFSTQKFMAINALLEFKEMQHGMSKTCE